jgi:hypothetical protein
MISEHSKEEVAVAFFGGRGIALNLLEALKPPSLSFVASKPARV